MAKQRMIVTDEQLLIDMDLFFNAVRDNEGNWQQVETELHAYQQGVAQMARAKVESTNSSDSRERMMVSDDQLIIDVELLFSAIRESDGKWEQVEKDMRSYVEMVRNMAR